ncbi:MAG: N-acetyltransferase [Flavobacterium sp.]|nr:N-acetyltransferase [Flavobacterium sp.]
MEIKDNELLRQFEINTEEGLVAIEYSLQERKIFLTKFCSNGNEDLELHNEFIKNVLDIAESKKLKVVPTHAKIISFFRKNRRYQEMLPPGIKI